MAVTPKLLPDPCQPTQQEIRDRELSYLPYRLWCRHCVLGRGKSQAHYKMEAEKFHAVPHVSMD